MLVPSNASSSSRWFSSSPIASTYDVGRVTLQVLEPLEAVPPAELIFILAIRRSMFSPRSYCSIFGTNKQWLKGHYYRVKQMLVRKS